MGFATVFLAGFAGLLVLVPAFATPSAESLLDQMTKKFGEPVTEVFQGRGEVSWVGLDHKGTFEETYRDVGQARVVFQFEEFGRVEIGHDGGYVWESSLHGVTIRRGWEASEHIRRFGRVLNKPWRDLYEGATLVGSEEIDGHRCHKVELAPKLLSPDPNVEAADRIPPPDLLYLDESTLLPRRVHARVAGEDGKPTEVVIDYLDYRLFEGRPRAYERHTTISGFTSVQKFESFQKNVELAVDFFTPDPEVRLVASGEKKSDLHHRDQDIVIETLSPRSIASIRVQFPKEELQRQLSIILPETLRTVTASGSTVTGPPMVRYHTFGDEIDLEAAMPIATPIEPSGRVKPEELPGGRCLIAWHIGPYEELEKTHARIQVYMKEHGLEARSALWEEYWTDPGMEPDPKKWRTKIVCPIKEEKPVER